MSIDVHIPAPLRGFVAGEKVVPVSGTTVEEVLQALVQAHAALRPHLYHEEGALRSFVNVYVNDESIRDLEGEATPVTERDELFIIPSIAGGLDRSPQRPGRGGNRSVGQGAAVNHPRSDVRATSRRNSAR